MTTSQHIAVSTDGLRLPFTDEPLDVLFDGRRIFSIHPDRQRRRRDGSLKVPWPRVLRPHLHGSAVVTLRAVHSMATIFTEEVIFDDSAERVRFVDAEGHLLVVDKWDKAKRPFAAAGQSLGKALVADIDRLLTLLNDELGLDAFLAYGTLLGAIREGGFIAHDDDADVAYLSRYQHPADIAREGFGIGRALQRRGWHVERVTAGFVQVWADPDGDQQRRIDLFTAHYSGAHFTIERWVRAPLRRDAITPLRSSLFEGVPMPVPSRAEDVLAATYGPQWGVPDPSFKFSRPAALRDRSDAWFGYLRESRWRWERVAQRYEPEPHNVPSPFARWVDAQTPTSSHLVDVGCGVGSDALWFAMQRRTVTGLDYSPTSLAVARERASSEGVALTLDRLHLGAGRACVVQGARLGRGSRQPTLYARLLLDALDAVDRPNLWRLAATALRGGGRLFLEFRTTRSRDGSDQEARRPLRTTLDPDAVRAEIAARGGRVERCEVVDDEGWQVCRMRASWSQQGVG